MPAPLEDVFGRSPFIAQTFLCGDNKPHTVALIVPNMVELTAWVKATHQELVPLLPTPEQLADTTTLSIPLLKHQLVADLINSEV